MNKKLGKVAAIALSAAMISSAFAMSTSASFAATTKVTPKLVVASTPEVAAVNDSATSSGSAQELKLNDRTFKVTTTVGSKSHTQAGVTLDTLTAHSTSHAATYSTSNSSVVSVTGAGRQLNVTAKGTGTATVTATVKGVTINSADVSGCSYETQHDDGAVGKKDTATQDVTVKFNVHVYNNGTAFVVPTGITKGAYTDGTDEINYNTTGAYEFATVSRDSDTSLATYAPSASATFSAAGTQKDSFDVASAQTTTYTAATSTVNFSFTTQTKFVEGDKVTIDGKTYTVTAAVANEDLSTQLSAIVSGIERGPAVADIAPSATGLAVTSKTDNQYAASTIEPSVVAVTPANITVTPGPQQAGTTSHGAAANSATAALKDHTTSTTAGQSVIVKGTNNANATAQIVVKTNKTYKAAGNLTVAPASGYGKATDPMAGADNLKNVTIDLDGHDLTVNGGAVLGNVINAGQVTVTNGTVGTISGSSASTSTVTVASNDGNVKLGDIDTMRTVTLAPTDAGITAGKISAGTVEITGDTSKNNDGVFSSVVTGDITSDNVLLAASQDAYDKSAQGIVKVGNITTAGAVAVTAPDDADNLTVGTITGTAGLTANCPFDGKFMLAGGTFKTGDLKNIGEVNVGADAKLTAGTINTGVLKSAATANCDTNDNASVAGLTVNGQLTATSIYTQKISGGDGKIIVPANSFEIAAASSNDIDASNLTLQISNLSAGSVLYKAVANETAAFGNVVGVSGINAATASDGKTTYTAKDVVFAGIKLDKDKMDVGKDDAGTLSVSSVSGAKLPDGVIVKWQASKDTVELTPSADGLSCSVKSVGYTDGNTNDGNHVDVTATLQKDGVDYTAVDNYSKTAAVTLTAEAPTVLTTKVNGIEVNADTVVKVTQSTAVPVSFSSNKAIADFKYSTGNAKVAETGTKTAWSGTAGEYTVYTNGAVGSQAGVFVNGKKVFIVEITGRPFKCDTTYDISMKAGKKYSFKITPAKDAPIADFTFNTANDAALSTWGFTKNADGTVTATLKANEVGKYGVFVNINGQQYKVFAVSVAK